VCEWCGSYVAPGSTFCGSCGRSVRTGPQDQWRGPTAPTGPWAPPGQEVNTGNAFSIAAIVLGCIAFLICPILLGPAGIVMAAIGMSKHERLATTAMVISILGLVVGMILGFVVASSMSTP
jgi:hypothetical protein